jgi:phage tail sheath protein FI
MEDRPITPLPRSTVLSIEQELRTQLQWTRFEVDAPPLWARVAAAAQNALFERWRAGDLVGSTAAEAFFVECDRSTMTQADIDLGVVVAAIGVAVIRPAEFTVFRLQLPTASAAA